MGTHPTLSADALFGLVRGEFERVPDQRADNAAIALPDALMSGFAMFSLKDPSLLAFEARRSTDHNLSTIFKIGRVPCDTQMRTVLDDVELADLRRVYQRLHREVAARGELRRYVFLGGSYLVALDGTGFFSLNFAPYNLDKKAKSGSGER